MNGKQYNWLVSVVAIVATLAVLAGGQMVWQRFAVAQPLDKLFQGVDGVAKASWEEGKKDDVVQIYITLANVNNLQKTYSAINDGAKRILGTKPFKIHIEDKRTPELEQFYYNVHYHIQEAVATGNFSIMVERVQKQAADAGVAAKIIVEAKVVYLQLAKDGGEMYVVVPR